MEKEKKEVKQPNIFKLLWFIYKRYYHEKKFAWQMWALFFFEFLTNLYPLLLSYVMALLVDKSISVIKVGGSINEMIPVICLLGGVVLVWVFITNLQQYFNVITNMWIAYLDDEVYLRQYLKIEPQAYEDPEFVNDKSTLNWNGYTVYNSLYTAMSLIGLFPVVVISFVAIFRITPLLALCAIVASIPAALIVKKFGRRVWGIWNDRGEEKIKYSSYKNSIWTTSFEKYQEIFVFKYGNHLLEKAKAINKSFSEKLQANHNKRYFWSTIASLVSTAIYIFAIVYAINMVINGKISVGMLTFVIASYQKFNSDISGLFYDSSWILGNRKVIEKFYAIQNWKNKIVSGNTQLSDNKDGISLELRNVWFKYPNTKKWILKNLNFSINSDEDLAIVGKNGAGKTTLIKLILRIYDPSKGEILINGINIKELDLDSYYKNVGILSQSFNQLSIMAKDNIFVGNVDKERTQENLENAAKQADIHGTISKLPQGYDTFLSREVKGGVQLSGGQWQKLAIARAFYRDAKLLILDEPTSAVDALSEEKIFDSIRANAKDKTTLIVSHRFATVRKAKRIIVIDNGEIVEDGKHEELMNDNGLYAKMYKTQVEQN
jgi:ABC-type multidrug transport system fused ATPase/permease subunit